LASIGFGAFRDCSGFRGTLRLPDNIRIIGQSSFRGCSGFSGELHIPESVKRIGFGAFRDCCGFSGELHIPESVTSIGESASYGCNKIERVIFHNRNTAINPFLIPYSDIVIVGYRHSTAESYAREYGLVFEELEEEG
jgi:hypothetical protein